MQNELRAPRDGTIERVGRRGGCQHRDRRPARGDQLAEDRVNDEARESHGVVDGEDAATMGADQTVERWRTTTRARAVAASAERREAFVTTSEIPVGDVYTQADVADLDPDRDLGLPGEYPFTRGVQATMYRGRFWTMRQYAGFATAAETNQRFRYLLEQGQTGLSVAFDLPTQMGYDSDAPKAEGEVGRVGVPVSSLADMETLFDGIPLGDGQHVDDHQRHGARSSSRCTWPRPRSRASPRRRVVGDHPERHPQGVRRPRDVDLSRPGPRCGSSPTSSSSPRRELPRWNTISISGYHMREAGATAAQELAFTLADGDRLRRGRRGPGPGGRRLRAAALVLLRGLVGAVRGGGQVPGRPADVGPDHEGAVRRHEPAGP